jgi:hypothetical protein
MQVVSLRPFSGPTVDPTAVTYGDVAGKVGLYEHEDAPLELTLYPGAPSSPLATIRDTPCRMRMIAALSKLVA